MDLTIIKQTVEGYSQDSETGEATLGLEVLKRHVQDAAKFKSTDSTSDDSDSTVDLAALLMAKLSGVSYTDGSSANSDSVALNDDSTDSASVVEQLKSKLSQIDYSVLTNLPEFSQAMEGLSADQLPAMAKQFIRDKVSEANPELLTQVDIITASLNTKLQSAKSSSDLVQIRSEFKSQMNTLVEQVLNSAPKESTAPMMTSTNPVTATDSTDETATTDSTTTTTTMLGEDDDTQSYINYAGSSNKYANMFTSGDTSISIIYQCLLLFADMSNNEINMLLVDAQLTTANTNATDEINQALSAFSSLSEVQCPYVTAETNSAYDSTDTPLTTDASGNSIDASGNAQYIELYDLGAVFSYAYDPANANNTDIPDLQYSLSGLYDQLSDFDPNFEANVTSGSDFDETAFTSTFSNYVSQINTYISSIDPTLDQIDMLPTSTVYNTDGTTETVIDWGDSTQSTYTKSSSGAGDGTVSNVYTSSTTKTYVGDYTTTLSTAKTSGSTVSTTLSTQTQYDMSIYTQYTEAMLSFVSTQSTINQRMWS